MARQRARRRRCGGEEVWTEKVMRLASKFSSRSPARRFTKVEGGRRWGKEVADNMFFVSISYAAAPGRCSYYKAGGWVADCSVLFVRRLGEHANGGKWE